jgi:competence protein ComGC
MSEPNNKTKPAFGLLELIVIFFIIAFVIWVSTPNFIGGGHGSRSNACINNLRQIDAAANQFAIEKHLSKGDHINFPNDLTPYIKLNSAGKIPGCPMGGSYSIMKVGDAPTCTMSTLTPPHALQQ